MPPLDHYSAHTNTKSLALHQADFPPVSNLGVPNSYFRLEDQGHNSSSVKVYTRRLVSQTDFTNIDEYTRRFYQDKRAGITMSAVATPAAPTAPVTNDAAQTFGWTNTPGYDVATEYEYSISLGAWTPVTANPQPVPAGVLAIGAVRVRVKETVNNPAGAILSNAVAFT